MEEPITTKNKGKLSNNFYSITTTKTYGPYILR
ncbi:hypothetical protein NEF87_000963 [Candidatus Lokiarchaeum ossiferum]|uniref:Uncharacterized protein n=1 Tax=Candidatus Lokiarchaeum ossiferum TaxID=2951803 RepID=A0ABY6HMD9_9ARCH|nr:hypothetical protein NEF87_000963 [Candidatus Lokiarchaeum sp. B-35]